MLKKFNTSKINLKFVGTAQSNLPYPLTRTNVHRRDANIILLVDTGPDA